MAEQVTLENCEREPIHIPGAVQPHGALVAARGADLVVAQISSNAARFFGIEARAALGRPLVDLFAAADRGRFADLAGREELRDENPVRVRSASGVALDAALHRSADLFVVEVEHASPLDDGASSPGLRRSLLKLQTVRTATDLAQIAANEVRELTGFDRVMVYRFDPKWNGQVVAEARRADLEPFLGLHYPASDIPSQARRLYTQNWLRLIGDIAYEPVPMLAASDHEPPLDMTHAHLRSVSPIHIEYLTNMGVSASMSISLIADGELVGLIACHHYSGPRVITYVRRETAEYLGQALSWNLHVLERADLAERTRRVQRSEAEVATSLAGADDLLEGLAGDALRELTDAAGAAVVLEEGVRTYGKTPDSERIAELVSWLRTQKEDVFATDNLEARFGPAREWDGICAGLIAVTLSQEVGEYLLWFRPSTERTVDWAGDPRKQAMPADGASPPRLSPRGSFALWRETVRGVSLPWGQWQIDAASNIRRLLVGGARRRVAVLRALNKRLVEADRAKDVFIATVSHELRTPLHAISGWSKLSLSGGLPAARQGEAMAVVSRNADALARIVDDLLDVSRIVSGNIALDVENVDVGATVEAVIEAMTLASESKEIRLKRVLGSASLTVLGDVGRIRQIVTVLLSNAIKFTPKGGSITISLRREGSDLALAVEDTGAGLEASALPHIFDAFWQADGTAKRQNQGLGLGLAIAKKLAELHGGRLTAESPGLGLGATFRVRLPVASARMPDPASASVAPETPVARLLEGLVVIVAEDEDDSRALITQILENAGATVHAASRAEDAILLALSDRCDVIVSDIGMPHMDGLEMIAALRSDPSRAVAKVPAVALTAYTRAIDRTAALRAGFQAHVAKPTDAEELVAVVASVVRRL